MGVKTSFIARPHKGRLGTYRRRADSRWSFIFLTPDAKRIRVVLRHCVFTLRFCFCSHWRVVIDQVF